MKCEPDDWTRDAIDPLADLWAALKAHDMDWAYFKDRKPYDRHRILVAWDDGTGYALAYWDEASGTFRQDNDVVWRPDDDMIWMPIIHQPMSRISCRDGKA